LLTCITHYHTGNRWKSMHTAFAHSHLSSCTADQCAQTCHAARLQRNLVLYQFTTHSLAKLTSARSGCGCAAACVPAATLVPGGHTAPRKTQLGLRLGAWGWARNLFLPSRSRGAFVTYRIKRCCPFIAKASVHVLHHVCCKATQSIVRCTSLSRLLRCAIKATCTSNAVAAPGRRGTALAAQDQFGLQLSIEEHAFAL